MNSQSLRVAIALSGPSPNSPLRTALGNRRRVAGLALLATRSRWSRNAQSVSGETRTAQRTASPSDGPTSAQTSNLVQSLGANQRRARSDLRPFVPSPSASRVGNSASSFARSVASAVFENAMTSPLEICLLWPCISASSERLLLCTPATDGDEPACCGEVSATNCCFYFSSRLRNLRSRVLFARDSDFPTTGNRSCK